MKYLRKFVISILCIGFSALVSIWALMWGWGLHPQNWTIVIWAPVIQFMVVVFQAIGSSDDK